MAWPTEAGSLGLIVAKPRRPRRPARVKSRLIGGGPARVRFYASARGKYRIFAAAEYRFYRSQSAPPVAGDTPFATSSTLPHEPADTYADGTWYLAVSWFNGIFDSGFLPIGPLGEPYLRLDLASGAETISPPAGPLRWHLQARAGGVVRVAGVYCQAGALRAGQWALAYTVDGSTPAADSPGVTQAMAAADLDYLVYDLPAQPHGTTVSVRLQTRRNDGTWVYSEGSEVETISADDSGPAAPRGMEV